MQGPARTLTSEAALKTSGMENTSVQVSSGREDSLRARCPASEPPRAELVSCKAWHYSDSGLSRQSISIQNAAMRSADQRCNIQPEG